MATLSGTFDTAQAAWTYATITQTEQPAPWREQYRMLEAMYKLNGVYEILAQMFQGSTIAGKDMRNLRSPAFRVVEFYASKTWPGMLPDALPIETKNKKIVEPIQQVWVWSNWSLEKQTCVRWFATFGDLFLKVATDAEPGESATRVFLQNIKPEYVSDFDADVRGYLQYIRMDIPRTRRLANGKTESYIHTEVWDKAEYRLWEHTKRIDEELEKLGPPTQSAPLASFGIDFVPIVWMPFRSIGDERGTGAFTLQLEKIDEANRQATRLHQMLFRHNKAFWALRANAVDKANRPLPAPKVGSSGDETLTVEDDSIISLPGMSELQSLVPQIDYAAALTILDAQLREIKEDLPELAYYSLREMGEPSGVAVRLLLSDALDRLLEARGNAETALVRAQQMALTIGQAQGLFSGLGTYESGALEHKFADRDVFPLSAEEKGAIVKTMVEAGFPLAFAARKAGFDEADIKQLEKDMAAEDERNATLASAALEQAQANMDREGNTFAPSQNGRQPERETA
jgi:hypothetical protein